MKDTLQPSSNTHYSCWNFHMQSVQHDFRESLHQLNHRTCSLSTCKVPINFSVKIFNYHECPKITVELNSQKPRWSSSRCVGYPLTISCIIFYLLSCYFLLGKPIRLFVRFTKRIIDNARCSRYWWVLLRILLRNGIKKEE